MGSGKTLSESPWRRVFEEVRREVGNRRDTAGVLGSINWLRKQMEVRGANPNVVRNIIYRDKGKLNDKRVLFEILNKLWQDMGQPPLQVPELEVLLSAGSSAENEVMQLLGREKRRAYRFFVGGVRGGEHPKLLVTGRPGSGKTLLTDYIQQALELTPRASKTIIRLEFNSSDLAASLGRLVRMLGVSVELFESRLVKVGMSSAFAVQADAQADLARLIVDALRLQPEPLVVLLHISQSAMGQDTLGMASLRLNTPEVPRVSASEWLWVSLLEPISRLPSVSLFVSMTELPTRALQTPGHFEGPIKLSPPTAGEARRFVKARLPHLPPKAQDAIISRAGRSFEDLRTLTLLAEIREPLLKEGVGADTLNLEQLSALVEGSGDKRLRDFLGALAILSLPEFPAFHEEALAHLRPADWGQLSSLESAFLDAVPGKPGQWRCFSRQLVRALRGRLQETNPERYRQLNSLAGHYYEASALENPKGEAASRYLHHLLEARAWEALEEWLSRYGAQQSLLRRVWQAANEELLTGTAFEATALQVASHYVKLGSYDHPDVVATLEILARSERPELRAWTKLKQAEGQVLKGHYEEAEQLLEDWPDIDDPTLNAEVKLVHASVLRWRSQLAEAAETVNAAISKELPRISQDDAAGRLLHAKVAVWAGLIAKDRGDLEGALARFESVESDDDLIRARVAFQKGDVQMKLGRFDRALLELSEAVRLSHKSEALAYEKTRYLARLGTLHRRRAEHLRAAQTFDAALATIRDDAALAADLNVELDRAKVEDERAILLLGLGRFDEAILTLQRNINTFRRYSSELGVDTTFRVLRTTLRLSLAYGCRALAQPYRLPLTGFAAPVPDLPDVLHARNLVKRVQERVRLQPETEESGPLHWQTLLVTALLGEPNEAITAAEAALRRVRFPAQEAQARAYLASTLLRDGQIHAALESTAAALAAWQSSRRGDLEGGDAGLLAWLLSLEIGAYGALGDARRAADTLVKALENEGLAQYSEAILRGFADVSERHGLAWAEHEGLRRTLELSGGFDNELRLADALVMQWQSLADAVVVVT